MGHAVPRSHTKAEFVTSVSKREKQESKGNFTLLFKIRKTNTELEKENKSLYKPGRGKGGPR